MPNACLLQRHASDIAELAKADTLVELGAGACDKTRVLLTGLQEAGTLARYVPFDVSDEFLRAAATTLSDEFDGVAIHLVIGDFHHHLAEIPTDGRRLIAFLGGTIGNLDPAQRARFLFDLNCTMSSDDSLLLGTDLVKDRARLVAAYDDAAGVTADFNRNVLHVLNEQLGGDFEPSRFRHVARWNEDEQWIEMRLRAEEETEVMLAGAGITVRFDEGEELLTEISAKFTPARVEEELAEAGFVVEAMWGAGDGEFLLTARAPLLLTTPTQSARAPPHPTGAGTRATGSDADSARSSCSVRRRRLTSHPPSSTSSKATAPRLSTLAASRWGGR